MQDRFVEFYPEKKSIGQSPFSDYKHNNANEDNCL